MKKYRLLDSDTKVFFGRTLFRIQALNSFGNVQEGDLGGYIEKEKNLSHDGNAWVYNNAQVFDEARVFDTLSEFETEVKRRMMTAKTRVSINFL